MAKKKEKQSGMAEGPLKAGPPVEPEKDDQAGNGPVADAGKKPRVTNRRYRETVLNVNGKRILKRIPID